MYSIKTFLFLLLSSLALSSCEFIGDEKDEADVFLLTDYIDFKITHSERVGSVLIADFTASNKTKHMLHNIKFEGTLSNWTNSSKDDLGEEYDTEVALEGNAFANSQTFSLKEGESIKGRFRILDFDPLNKATRFSLVFISSIESEKFKADHSVKNLRFTDKRVLNNGFQTPDPGLQIVFAGSSRDKEAGEAYVTFKIKNVSGGTIHNLTLLPHYADMVTDNTGRRCRFNGIRSGEEDYQNSFTSTIAPNETISYTVQITQIHSDANTVSGVLSLTTSDYILCDNTGIRFFGIPLN